MSLLLDRAAAGNKNRPIAAKIQIYTLGSLQVVRQDHVVTEGDWHTRQARQLLKILITERPRPISTDRLIEILWPNSPPHAAATTLRSAINALRNVLEPDRPNRAPSEYIITESPGYAFRRHPDIWLDVEHFEAALNGAATTPDPQQRQHLLTQAIELYQDDYLISDPYADWAQIERERLRERYFAAVLQLAEIQASQGDYTAALAACRQVLARDPVRENAYQALMRYQAETGDSAGALLTYERCRTILSEELGADPSPLTQLWHQRILNGEVEPRPAQPATRHPPRATHHPPPATLPQQSLLPPVDAEFVDQLVGRDDEMQRLAQTLQTVLSGRGRLVLLEGEAGVGKTRLAYQLLQASISAGASVISAAGQPLERQLPFAPLADSLGRYLHSLPAGTLHRLPAATLAQLAQIVPTLQDRLPDLSPLPTDHLLGSDEKRQRLIDSIVGFLTTLAGERPLVFFLDDLHWADGDTLAVLSRLTQRVTELPLLLLLAYRSDDLAENEALATLLHSFKRSGQPQWITLERLTQTQVQDLLQRVQPNGDHANTAAMLYTITGGNALFVTEALRDLQERAQAAPTDPPLTLYQNQRVQGVILERMGRLPDAARPVLQLSAVIGRDFSAELLEHAATDDPSAGLETLLQRKFLWERADERFDFSHQLVREVAYRTLNSLQRRRLHHRVADALVQLDRPAKNPSEIAFHYDQAGSQAQQPFAHYSVLAGEALLRTYGFRPALDRFDRALRVLESAPDSPPDLIRRALQGRALAYEGLFDPDGVTESYRRLQHWAGQQGDHALLLTAHGRLTSMLGLLGQQRESNELLRELIEAFATQDRSGFENLTGLSAPPALLDLFERRLQLYSPNPAQDNEEWTAYTPPPAVPPNPVGDFLGVLGRAHATLPLLDYGWTLLVQGQLPEARRCIEAVVELATENAQPLIASTAYHQLAAIARLQGTLPRSQADNERSVALNRAVQGMAAELASLWPRIGSALRSLDAGRLDEAERRLRRVVDFLDQRATFRNHRHSANIGLGLVALARGDLATARTLLEDALADASNLYPYTHSRALLGLAEIAARQEEPQRQAALLRQALRFAGERSLLEEYVEVLVEIGKQQPVDPPPPHLFVEMDRYLREKAVVELAILLRDALSITLPD